MIDTRYAYGRIHVTHMVCARQKCFRHVFLGVHKGVFSG